MGSYALYSDILELKDFYKEVYPNEEQYKSGTFFDWIYLAHSRSELPVVIVKDNAGKIIAHEGLYHDSIKISGVEQQVTWGTDLIVHPDYRGQGIAKRIHKYIHEQENIYLAIAMASSTWKLLKQFEPVKLEPVKSLVYIINSNIFANERMFQSILKHEFRVFGKMLLFIQKKILKEVEFPWLKKYLLPKQVEFSYKNIIESSFDDPGFRSYRKFFEEKHDNCHVYTSELIKWKFVDQPGKDFRLFLYKDISVKGYVIIRIHNSNDSPIGIISDIEAEDPASFLNLVNFCREYFKDLMCSSVFVLASDKEKYRQFKKAGFLIINKRVPLLISKRIKKLKNRAFHFNYESHDLDRYFNFRY